MRIENGFAHQARRPGIADRDHGRMTLAQGIRQVETRVRGERRRDTFFAGIRHFSGNRTSYMKAFPGFPTPAPCRGSLGFHPGV